MKYWLGEYIFCPRLPSWIIIFFILHANTPVPSRQRHCFADCDSRVTWWQQSNFHMNNYPAVRVGSSFISIWWTRRIVLTKTATRAIVFRALGTGRRLTGLVHFSSIPLPWPKYASTLKVGSWAKHFLFFFLLTKQAVRGFMHLYIYKFFDMFCFFFPFSCVLMWPPSFQGRDFPSLGVAVVLLSVYWSVTIPTVLLSPSCQLDSSRKIRDYRRDTCTQHIECSSVQTHSSTKLSQPLTSASLLIGQSLLLNQQRKANSVWPWASRDHFPVLTVLCPPCSWMLALSCVDTAGQCEEPD